MGRLLRRFNYWLHRRRIEQDLAEEIELHRALKQEELEKSGLHPEEATFASRRSLGNVLLVRLAIQFEFVRVGLDLADLLVQVGNLTLRGRHLPLVRLRGALQLR